MSRALVKHVLLLLLLALVTLLPSRAVYTGDSQQAAAGSSVPWKKKKGNSSDRTAPLNTYIVELVDEPVVGYGEAEEVAVADNSYSPKVNLKDAKVRAYAQYLDTQAAAVATKAGVASKLLHRFRYTVAGFTVTNPTVEELERLRQLPEVATVHKDSLKRVQTYSTPKFLGLAASGPNATDGVWQQIGRTKDQNWLRAGEGVIVGMVDTGVWMEDASFNDRKGLKDSGIFAYGPLTKAAGYTGKCVAGDKPPTATCNRKVVGCQHFAKGLGGDASVRANIPEEFNSCRDVNGHGSHTASIAAGNINVPVEFGQASGMAPRARLAVYKALWGPDGEGTESDVIEAIEQAVVDGVDILNYSAGSDSPITSFNNILMKAFMKAAQAGVFVAAAAGNSGPTASTVDNIAPWITTVAASTHSRPQVAQLQLADGRAFSGASVTPAALGPSPLLLASFAAMAGVSVTDARQCMPGTLDPAQADGKIVVCDKAADRLGQSMEVQRAGGIGMVLLNTNKQDDDVVPDPHVVPTIHLKTLYRLPIRQYAGTSDAEATISAAMDTGSTVTPQMASFSSRGPAIAGDGAVLKPDVTAPGVGIYAAFSPAASGGLKFKSLSGTSMATPHVTGLAALIKSKYPRWSPMMIKSAFMTTAYQTTQTGVVGRSFGNPFDYGAGHVNPRQMLNPGLVFDSRAMDWSRFVCGAEAPAGSACSRYCSPDPTLCLPYNLNSPSISLPAMKQQMVVVQRTVTSVLGKAGSFTLASAAFKGAAADHMRITVVPETFTLNPGGRQALQIKIEALEGVPQHENFFGSVVWTSDSNTTTRIPVLASVTMFEGPSMLTLAAADGLVQYNVTPGFTGTLNVGTIGLVRSKLIQSTIKTGQEYNYDFKVPANTTSVLFSMFNADMGTDLNDFDLFVMKDGVAVAVSSGETSDESVALVNPEPGTYQLQVDAYYVALPMPFTVHQWILREGSATEQTLQASPSSAEATAQQPQSIQLNYIAANATTGAGKPRYAGVVTYKWSSTPVGATSVMLS